MTRNAMMLSSILHIANRLGPGSQLPSLMHKARKVAGTPVASKPSVMMSANMT